MAHRRRVRAHVLVWAARTRCTRSSASLTRHPVSAWVADRRRRPDRRGCPRRRVARRGNVRLTGPSRPAIRPIGPVFTQRRDDPRPTVPCFADTRAPARRHWMPSERGPRPPRLRRRPRRGRAPDRDAQAPPQPLRAVPVPEDLVHVLDLVHHVRRAQTKPLRANDATVAQHPPEREPPSRDPHAPITVRATLTVGCEHISGKSASHPAQPVLIRQTPTCSLRDSAGRSLTVGGSQGKSGDTTWPFRNSRGRGSPLCQHR